MLFLFFVCVAIAICVWVFYPRGIVLQGLLVDLELKEPDTSRYERIREAFTRRLSNELPGLHHVGVVLDYAHFLSMSPAALDPARVDFVILSPQGTPWHRYQGEARAALDEVGKHLRHAVFSDSIPVLGICGGHQFLALAFGGTVNFIDPELSNSPPDHYPSGGTAERGVVVLETLGSDPILEGVTRHPGRFAVLESHYEEVKSIPPGFVNLATSEMSPIQLMRLPGQVVYGMAFHPERCWNDGDCSAEALTSGRRMLANFLAMVSEAKKE